MIKNFKMNISKTTSGRRTHKYFVIEYIVILSLILILSVLSINYASAYRENGHISLLTVAETSSNTTSESGGVADLYLSIKSGTGRIFIDSFPLSKLDTQITMRFASEIACDYLDKDCSQYDFFYTIRANSAIVGGPSAGAAATVLTIAMLDNQNLDNNTIMTGTINSGNLIGPVGGIRAKTLAAQEFGFTKVLIPKWDTGNDTLAENLTIKVAPISTLEQALYEFTGKSYETQPNNVVSSDKYNQIMMNVTKQLCTEYGSLQNDVIVMPNLSQIIKYDFNLNKSLNPDDGAVVTINDEILNTRNESGNVTINATANSRVERDYFNLALNAINNQEYYSAASFCFGGNVRITTELMKNDSNEKLKIEYAKLINQVSDFENNIEEKSKNFSTISELETYMVVKERLNEVHMALDTQDMDNISYQDMAYAKERFNTAIVWSQFFALPGTKFTIDNTLLKNVCLKKLSEAEERMSYLQYYLPTATDRGTLSLAYTYYNTADYALCIFTASKAKADIDVVLSALFVTDKSINTLGEEKINAAKKAISREESHNIFPILGYSYYEYANNLIRTDPYSSLIYSEYSLELSNLDMYFPKKTYGLNIRFDENDVSFFFLGFAIGILIVVISLFIIFKTRFKKNAPEDTSAMMKLKKSKLKSFKDIHKKKNSKKR